MQYALHLKLDCSEADYTTGLCGSISSTSPEVRLRFPSSGLPGSPSSVPDDRDAGRHIAHRRVCAASQAVIASLKGVIGLFDDRARRSSEVGQLASLDIHGVCVVVMVSAGYSHSI